MKKIKYKATITLELTKTVTDEEFKRFDLETERISKDKRLRETIEFGISDYVDTDMAIHSEIVEVEQ